MENEEYSRMRLVASYGALLGVNAVFGAGLFGVPTNATISTAYPSVVTPAGFAFAIWGPIFLLEGGGVGLMVSTKTRRGRAATAWMACWAAECAWQLVFAQAPIPAEAASSGSKLLVLVPAALCLFAAQGSMLLAAARLRFARTKTTRTEGLTTYALACANALLVDLPTGLNAGWLAAASGIGTTLVAQQLPAVSWLAEPQGGAILVTTVSGLGAVASAVFGSKTRSLLVGVGYAAATAWACYGITKSDSVTPEVKVAAQHGIWFAVYGVSAAAISALASAVCSRRDGSKDEGNDPQHKKPLSEAEQKNPLLS